MSKSKRKISGSRYKHDYESRNKGGNSRIGVLDWTKLKDRPDFYELKKGVNRVNIIPFIVKSKSNPIVREGILKVGDVDYLLDVWVHRFVGPSEADVLCPKKNFGKACPICEESSKMYDLGKKAEGKALKPSRRCFYNVQPIIQGEPQDLKILDISHFFFEKELIDEARECSNGDDIVPFADIENGQIIKFRAAEEVFEGRKFLKCKSFGFEDREEELDDSLIDKAVSFDELMVIHSYEEIENLYFGNGDEEEEEDEEEEKPKKKKVVDSEEDEEEEEEEEAPRKKKPVKIEEEEEDEEEEVKPKKAKPEPKKQKKSECPNGMVWGKDCDSKKICKKCPDWDECVEAQEELGE